MTPKMYVIAGLLVFFSLSNIASYYYGNSAGKNSVRVKTLAAENEGLRNQIKETAKVIAANNKKREILQKKLNSAKLSLTKLKSKPHVKVFLNTIIPESVRNFLRNNLPNSEAKPAE